MTNCEADHHCFWKSINNKEIINIQIIKPALWKILRDSDMIQKTLNGSQLKNLTLFDYDIDQLIEYMYKM